MKKILIIVCVFLGVLLLAAAGVGVWAYGEFLHTEPLTEAELAELTTDWDEVTGGNWSPWWDAGDGTKVWNPAASYNAWVSSIPEDDRAWPALVDAYYTHFDLLTSDAIMEHIGTLPTDPERWSLLAPELASPGSDGLLDELLHAYERPEMGGWLNNDDDPYEHAAMVKHFQAQPEPAPGQRQRYQPGPLKFDPEANLSLMDAWFPWLGRQRYFASFMRSKAGYELEQGDIALFVETVMAMLRSSDMGSDVPTIIGLLVDSAIDHAALVTIDWALVHHGDAFDDAALKQLDDAIRAHGIVEFIWQGEALQFNDTLRRLGDTNGKLAPGASANVGPGMGMPTSLPDAQLHPSSQRALLVYHRLLKTASERSTLDWDGISGQIDRMFQQHRGSLNSVTELMLDIMLPSLDQTATTFRQNAQQTVGTRLAIAAYRHRARHGSYADTLETIDDDLINFDPIDAFTGESLKYTLTETGPVIYSVGDDRVDDGGMIRWEIKFGDSGEQRRTRTWPQWHTTQEAAGLLETDPESIRGDWVLFPIPVSDPEPIDESDFDPDWDLQDDG